MPKTFCFERFSACRALSCLFDFSILNFRLMAASSSSTLISIWLTNGAISESKLDQFWNQNEPVLVPNCLVNRKLRIKKSNRHDRVAGLAWPMVFGRGGQVRFTGRSALVRDSNQTWAPSSVGPVISFKGGSGLA